MRKTTTLAIALALCTAAGIASADNGDSSMNAYTGDSYAYFNGGHNLGDRRTEVTIAKAPKAEPRADEKVAVRPRREIDFGHHAPPLDANS
jgi:hypothetical protein